MPPPSWIIAILLTMGAHAVVTVVVFFRRGWKRGAVSIVVGLLFFLLSVVLGVLVNVGIYQLDPAPLVLVLAAGVVAAYAFMMRSPNLSEDTNHVV